MQPVRVLHLIIWVYTAVHLLVAALLPLIAHEAHYALYARHLQLSYLDHPPLAAWLQALMVQLTGADFGLRLVPIALSVATQYLLARLTARLYPAGSPWLPVISVLILQGTLVFHASLAMSPDVPLLTLGLLVVLSMLQLQLRDRWRDWLLLGVWIGLAGLAKYTAVTLALSALIALLIWRGWTVLLTPRLWLTGVVSLLLVSPVIVWNWQNDWLTVSFHADYQFNDIERWSVAGFLRALAEQVVFYTPLLVVGGGIALWRVLRSGRITEPERLLAVFVAPVLVLYLVTALESRASAHWSMLGWLLLIPLLSRWLSERWQESSGLRWLTWISGTYSVALLAAIPLLLVPVGTWPEFKHPVRLVLGWEAATSHGDRLRASLDARGYRSEPVLLARNWHHAGLLDWYGSGVTVRNVFHDLNPHNVQRGWSGPDTWGVLVHPRRSHEPRHPALMGEFECELIDSRPVFFGASLVRVFHYYGCYSIIAPDDRVPHGQKTSPTPK